MGATASLHPDSTAPSNIVSLIISGESASFGLPLSLTSFVGRDQEIKELSALLRLPETRLLTLTGPGGIGKTRLALRVAETLAPEFERGVLFVPLAAIDDPSLVAAEVGRAFGLNDSGDQMLADRINSVLAGETLLLVLDNFERLVDTAPLLVRLLSTCSSLTILTTSRVVLRVSGEREFRVTPLDLPNPETSIDQIGELSAVRLFLDRAHLSGDSGNDQAAVVATICQRLDGLPLAIELAAAKTRVLSLPDLLERLDQRLPLLDGGPRDSPPRLRSMRDAIAWSYGLLTNQEQALLRMLSVFEGGFTLAAAEGIASPALGTPVIQILTSLVDHSLVHRVDSADSPARYAMLETVREFAFEILIAHGEDEIVAELHLRWFIDALGFPTAEKWFDPRNIRMFTLANEQENLRSALNWALGQREIDKAAQIAWGLLPFYRRNGLYTEAAAVLGRIAEFTESLEPILAAAVNLRLADFHYNLGELAMARTHATTALQICRQSGHPLGIRSSLNLLGVSMAWSDVQASITLMSEALEISLTLQDNLFYAIDLRQLAFAYTIRGDLQRASDELKVAMPILEESPGAQSNLAFGMVTAAWVAGLNTDYAAAERIGKSALALSSTLSIPECQSFSLRILGEVAFARKEYARAVHCFKEALRLVYQSALRLWDGLCYAELALAAYTQRDWKRAAYLYGAAGANWNRLGVAESARGLATWSGRHSPAQESLSDEQFALAYAAGQKLTAAEAFTEAMAVTVDPGSTADRTSILSRREYEVIRLIAGGRTNREIADTLFVSKRTVDSHVLSLLSKLGVNSRREAVATARERGVLPAARVDS